MTTLTLRKVGGSTMLALSPALLQILGRRAGEQVVIKVESGRLIIEPKVARRRVSKYNLSDLLKEQEKIQAEKKAREQARLEKQKLKNSPKYKKRRADRDAR